MAATSTRQGPFVVIAEFDVKPDGLERFLVLARDDASQSVAKEPGCHQFDVTVEQTGAPLGLYNAPANRFVAGFIGSPRMNFLDGRIRAIDGAGVTVAIDGLPEQRVAVDGGSTAEGEPVTLGVRPEHVVPGEADACFSALVNATEQLGSDSYLYCELPGGQKLTIHAPGQTPVRRGERTPIGLRPDACHLFRADEEGCALPRRA